MSYWKNIAVTFSTIRKGMALSLGYFFQARKKRKKEYLEDKDYFKETERTFTVQFPKEEIPVPDIGRYKLHNEIDDCIVCDKCAKICPVDCIEIEPIRATETYGTTSDGTPLRIHAAKFDIDMAKCCFCGLCTVVCPTECLTMTKEFDYSTDNIQDHNFPFSKMSEKEIDQRKKEFEEFQASKESGKEKPAGVSAIKKSAAKPVFKPRPIPKKK